ncbi:MAG: hypothetical protein OEM24_13520, partial [Paracoccaceae bacterium]|nr:hypothetical protein [Paracoccaceae bacterium]
FFFAVIARPFGSVLTGARHAGRGEHEPKKGTISPILMVGRMAGQIKSRVRFSRLFSILQLCNWWSQGESNP